MFHFFFLDGIKKKAEIIANNMCVTQEVISRNGRLYYPHTQILYTLEEKKSKIYSLFR